MLGKAFFFCAMLGSLCILPELFFWPLAWGLFPITLSLTSEWGVPFSCPCHVSGTRHSTPALGSQVLFHRNSSGLTARLKQLFLAALHGMWDLSSLTRDRTCAPCIGSAESQLLDHQGSPLKARF